MYPVKFGYAEAELRINRLVQGGFEAEAFVTTVFTLEKTFYRVFRQLIISAGFPSSQATVLLGGLRGFENIKKYWECFDTHHNKLSEIIDQDALRVISDAQKIRNDIVHGKKVYATTTYVEKINLLLPALNRVRSTFQQRYAFDGWSKIRARKRSTLHQTDPIINI